MYREFREWQHAQVTKSPILPKFENHPTPGPATGYVTRSGKPPRLRTSFGLPATPTCPSPRLLWPALPRHGVGGEQYANRQQDKAQRHSALLVSCQHHV